MSFPNYHRDKGERERDRKARKALKLAKKMLRKEQKQADTLAQRQPPMTGSTARIVGEI